MLGRTFTCSLSPTTSVAFNENFGGFRASLGCSFYARDPETVLSVAPSPSRANALRRFLGATARTGLRNAVDFNHRLVWIDPSRGEISGSEFWMFFGTKGRIDFQTFQVGLNRSYLIVGGHKECQMIRHDFLVTGNGPPMYSFGRFPDHPDLEFVVRVSQIGRCADKAAEAQSPEKPVVEPLASREIIDLKGQMSDPDRRRTGPIFRHDRTPDWGPAVRRYPRGCGDRSPGTVGRGSSSGPAGSLLAQIGSEPLRSSIASVRTRSPSDWFRNANGRTYRGREDTTC